MHSTKPRQSIAGSIRRALGVALLAFAPFAASAATTNYSTGFESAEGYSSGTGLAGFLASACHGVSTSGTSLTATHNVNSF